MRRDAVYFDPPLTHHELARFWSQVDRRGPDECWPWTGGLNAKGYGVFHRRIDGIWVKRYAHRVSFVLAHGHDAVPACRHRCDNPPCVNPGHLQLGTNTDNIRDRVERGRSIVNKGNARLRPSEVRAIYALRASGRSTRNVASEFNIGATTVSNIWHRRRWPELLA